MTSEQIQKLKEFKSRGCTIREICVEMKMTRPQVRYYLNKHGLTEKIKKGLTCPECGEVFDQKNSTQKFCSKTCTDRYSQNKTRPPQGDIEVSINCGRCGSEFETLYRHSKYCSRCKGYNPVAKVKRNCDWCGEAYETTESGSGFCKEKCSYYYRYSLLKEERLLINKICIECGKHFSTTNKTKKFCSSPCGKTNSQRRKEVIRRKKLKENGFVDFGISIERLMKRDRKTCYLCNGKCDLNDRTVDSMGYVTVGPNYPSIDHVTPVSKGGTHTWDNVKLAHHYCNSLKRDY